MNQRVTGGCKSELYVGTQISIHRPRCSGAGGAGGADDAQEVATEAAKEVAVVLVTVVMVANENIVC